MSHLCRKCGEAMPKDRKGFEQICPECQPKEGMNIERFIQDMCKGKSKEWVDGFYKGCWAFAHWKDGVQYVGTTGTKLKDVVEVIRKMGYTSGILTKEE